MNLIQIRVTAEQFARIERAAAATFETPTGYSRRIIAEALGRLEEAGQKPMASPPVATAPVRASKPGKKNPVVTANGSLCEITGITRLLNGEWLINYSEAGERCSAVAAVITGDADIVAAIEDNGSVISE